MSARAVLTAFGVVFALGVPSTASATFSGHRGRIAVSTTNGIFSIAANGKHLRREPGTKHRDAFPSWSRDGRSLAFGREVQIEHPDDGSSTASEQSLYVRPADGGTPVMIHHADYHDPCGGTPQDTPIGWSSDDRSVLAHHQGWDGPFDDFEPGFSDCNGSGGFFSAPVTGGTETWYGPPHTGCRGLLPSAASPDGNRVAGGDPCRHDRIVVATLSPWHATSVWKPPKNTFAESVDFSPDGKRLVFDLGRSAKDGSTDLLGLFVLSVSGGTPHRIAKNAWLPVWSPDGGRVAFANLHGVSTIPAGGGKRRLLHKFNWASGANSPLSLNWQPQP